MLLNIDVAYSASILDLQKYKETSSREFEVEGGKKGTVSLTNLNPNINTWYLLEVQKPDEKEKQVYHIENLSPSKHKLLLTSEYSVAIKFQAKSTYSICDFYSNDLIEKLKKAIKRNNPYTPACNDQILIRNKTSGRQTAKEYVTDFLRSHVWGGEQITSFVKDHFFKDKYMIKSESQVTPESSQAPKQPKNIHFPKQATIDPKHENALLEPKHLGIAIDNKDGAQMRVGVWYQTKYQSGVFVSAIQPKFISEKILNSYPKRVSKLDGTEASALTYLVAFDLNQFNIGFVLGTDHPRVEWSPRVLDEVKDNSMPGPDGIGDINPLIATGKINPQIGRRVAATFTGGFKRNHGVFRWGKLSKLNKGSHYGFMEQGIVFSTLQPNLATVTIDKNGRFGMKTWGVKDNEFLLPKLKHTRQNGVPIIDGYDKKLDAGIPGLFVNNWGKGNWSGSSDSKLRALRAAMCFHTYKYRRFLIYGYFSTATPRAMARVFQAYGCEYAQHLDMNALEHTYLAIYSIDKENYNVQHLIKGMDVLDSKYKDRVLPRFVGMADNRDFFYIERKSKK